MNLFIFMATSFFYVSLTLLLLLVCSECVTSETGPMFFICWLCENTVAFLLTQNPDKDLSGREKKEVTRYCSLLANHFKEGK